MGILDKATTTPEGGESESRGSPPNVEPAGAERADQARRHAWLWMPGAALFSLALTLLVCRSALRSGYLLQVDAAFGPKAPPYVGGFYAPIWALEKLSVDVLGGAVTGKIYLFGVVFLAGALPMVLLRRQPWWSQLFAGTLGILNPFIYDRLVEGQWTVIASCDGLFLWLITWDLLDEGPTLARAAGMAAATFLIVSFSAHFAGILLVLAAACVIGSKTWRSRRRLRALAAAGALSVLALIPGAVLFLTGSGGATVSQLSSVTTADLRFFHPTEAPPFGVLDLFGLYGYWGERLGRFPVATAHSSWWVLPAIALIVLAVVGAVADRRRAWLLASGYVGVAVSLAISMSWGTSAFGWLAGHLHLLRGYREPEKWSALWLVALVVLGAVAIGRIARSSWPRWPLRALALALAFLAVAAPAGLTEIRGAGTILEPVHYPAAWYGVSRYLSRAAAPGTRVMILPWHLYETFSFAGGRLTENPGDVFFPGKVLTSESDEIPGDPPPVGSPGWAERKGSSTCSLVSVVRAERADFVVVERAGGSAADIQRLVACGMVDMIADPEVSLLAWPRHAIVRNPKNGG